MSSNGISQRWTIGSDPACDVVVSARGVEPCHAIFERVAEGFRILPQQGTVAVGGQDAVAWLSQPRPVRPGTEVWLAPDVACPWPCPHGASKLLSVGRATDCDVVIDHPAVSGRHALLIVGRCSTVVLVDQNSRNGIFLQPERKQRIQAIGLRPGAMVYLGTHGVAAGQLLAATSKPQLRTSTPSNARDEPPDQAKTVDKPPAWHWAALGAGVMLAVVGLCGVLLAILWGGSPRPPAPVPVVAADVAAAAMPPAASVPPPLTTQPVAPQPVAPPSLETQVADTADGAETAVSPQSTDDVGQSVFWITLQHDGSGARYRLGSGVAVNATTVVTTGSILLSARSMQASGYSDLRVLSIDGKHDRKALKQQIWSVFEARSTKAEQLAAAYQRASAGEDDKTVIEQARESMDLAYASASAVDLGFLQCESLPGHVPLAPSTKYWPRRSVPVTPTGLDSEDPRLPPRDALPGPAPAVAFRVQETSAAVDGIAGAVLLSGAFTGSENWIGVPVFTNDRLAGLVTYQSPIDPSHGNSGPPILSLEFVSAETIRAALNP